MLACMLVYTFTHCWLAYSSPPSRGRKHTLPSTPLDQMPNIKANRRLIPPAQCKNWKYRSQTAKYWYSCIHTSVVCKHLHCPILPNRCSRSSWENMALVTWIQRTTCIRNSRPTKYCWTWVCIHKHMYLALRTRTSFSRIVVLIHTIKYQIKCIPNNDISVWSACEKKRFCYWSASTHLKLGAEDITWLSFFQIQPTNSPDTIHVDKSMSFERVRTSKTECCKGCKLNWIQQCNLRSHQLNELLFACKLPSTSSSI